MVRKKRIGKKIKSEKEDNVHYRIVVEKFIGTEWQPIEIFSSIQEVELELIETALALDKKRKQDYIS